jgi:site-specific DNA-cytosine methylase
LVAQPTVWPADCAGTLAQSASGTGSLGYSNQEIFSQHGANLIPQPVPIQDGREIQKAQNGIGVGDQGDPAYTLDTTGAQAVGQPVPYDLFQITAPVNRQNRKPGDPCHTLARDKAAHAAVVNMQGSKSNACVATDGTSFTLNAMHGHDVHAVAHAFYSTDGTHGVNQHPEVSPAVKVGSGLGIPSPPAVACCVAPTITAGNDPSRSPQSAEVTQQVAAVHAASMTVRRLTPRECERLQGFPDDYTLIPWRKKQAEDCPDGPRYKALGNSMAVNCMAWIGERIAAVDAQINERNET